MQVSRFDAIVGPAYSYPSKPVDCQECINFECIRVGSGSSPYQNMLVSTAGTRKISFRIKGSQDIYGELPTVTARKSRIRGIHMCSVPFLGDSFDGLVVVGSDAVWRVGVPDSDMVSEIVRIGVISEGFEPVSIVDAGGESGSDAPPRVLIADGKTLYVVDMDTMAFNSLGNTSPQRPETLAYLDARVFMSGTVQDDGKPSQRVYWSAINHPESWGELDFVSAASRGDPVLAVAVTGNMLWMVGTDTFEIWQTASSSGTVYTPIRRVTGVAGGVGTSSGKSVATVAASVFFVGGGSSGRLHIYQGDANGSISVISTDAMSQEFSGYHSMSDSYGFCWSDEGQSYYAVTFPSEDVTWVYNVGQKSWHKRQSTENTLCHRWKVDVTCNAWDMVLGGSIEDGKMYHVSRKYNDDDGVEIVRRRVAPHLRSNGKLLNHMSLELDLECGNALPYGQGSDPQVMLRALDGSGRVPREPRWKSSGTQGRYRRRVKWYRLGTAVDRCYEICVSDPIRWTIYGATIETEESKGGH